MMKYDGSEEGGHIGLHGGLLKEMVHQVIIHATDPKGGDINSVHWSE